MPETAVKIYPAGATPRRVDVDHGSGKRTAGARDQIAAARQLFTQEVYQPELLRAYIDALKQAVARYKRTGQEIPNDLITKKGFVKLDDIIAALTQFNQTLSSDLSVKELSLYDLTHLDRLDSAIITVSGSAASPEAAQPPTPNIPPDLKALVAEFDKAQQAAVSAQAKRQGWSPEEFRKQIALQDKITIQMHQVRQYTLSQLEWAINNSTALENLAASLGHKPEAVKRLALTRAKELVNGEITAQTFRQALLTNKINDPVFMASLYVSRLREKFLKDDLLILTAVDKDPKTKQKYLDTALKKTKETVAQETKKAQPAIEAAAKNLQQHPTVQKAAQKDAALAAEALAKAAAASPLPPAKAARLAVALARHPDNPDRQERIIRSAFGTTSSQAKVIRGQLAPQINQLAASSVKPNYLAMADPDSIFNDISLHPNRFPRPLVDAVRSGRISNPGKLADAIIISRNLNIPLEAVVLSQWGVDAQNLAGQWRQGPKFLGFIPMGHGPDQTSIAKLSNLAAAQKQLSDSLKQPPPLLPPQIPQQFLKTAARNSRAVRFSEFFDQINLFRLPSAFSYNLGRIPPLGAIGNSGSAFVSGLRVQSGFFNTVSNVMGYFNNTVGQTPSFLTAPFRAVSNAISNTIINPVKTWANTQIRSGLARAGAWLAKKGVTKAAQKIGGAVLGKAAAGLLGAAVGGPVGWVAGALTLLSTLGDIGKFIWANRKEIGFGLAGGFLLGQLLLGKLLGLLGSAAWTLGGAALGFAVGGPIGAAIGGTIGYLIGSGALGSVLSGLGTALGSAAAGLSSFIGAITAPSAFIGLAHTIASVSIFVSFGVGGYLIFQNQWTMFGGLFVAPDSGTFPPGGTPGGGPGGQYPTCWPSYGEISQGPYCGNNPIFSHCWLKENAIDIAGGYGIPVYATHDGTATAYPEAGISCYGNFVVIVSPFGFKTYYAHLTDITFSGSIEVKAGTQIGTQGKSTGPPRVCNFTGPHVHYELRPSSPSINEIVPSYTPGGITTGCFAKDSGGGTTPLPTSPPGRPTSTPSTPTPAPAPGTCAYYDGVCLDTCYGSGCGIASPQAGFPDCNQQGKTYCCNVTQPYCRPPSPTPDPVNGNVISGIVNIPLGGDFCLANVNAFWIRLAELHPEAPPGQGIKEVDKVIIESPPPPPPQIPFKFSNLKSGQLYSVYTVALLTSGGNYGGIPPDGEAKTTAPNTSVNLTNNVCTKNL